MNMYFTYALFTDILFISRKTLNIFLKTANSTSGHEMCEETMCNTWSCVFPFCNIQNYHGNLEFLSWNIIKKSVKFFEACLWEPWSYSGLSNQQNFWLITMFRFHAINLPWGVSNVREINRLHLTRKHLPPIWIVAKPLQWRHYGRNSVSNHQPYDCLLNRLFRRKSKKTSKLRVTDLWVGNSPGTGEFPAQMASYAENVSIWWRHHDLSDITVACRVAMDMLYNQTNDRNDRLF